MPRLRFLLALPATALLVHCVADDPVSNAPTPPVVEAGSTTDARTEVDARVEVEAGSGTDAGSDAAPDAGPICTIASGGPAGTLDPAFAHGLKAFPLVPGTYDTETAALDSQGRIYVIGRKRNCVGAATDFDVAIMRLAPSGALDVGFNKGKGYACFHNDTADSVVAAYVDTSDRLVFAGQTAATEGPAMVGRMLPTGELDPAFAGGKLLTFTPETQATGADYTASGISADGDNILVSGSDQHPFTASTKGWLVRLSSAGVLETSAFTPYISTDVAGFRGGHVKIGDQIFLPALKKGTSQWTLAVVDDKGVLVTSTGLASPPGATTFTLPQGIAVAHEKGKEDQLFVVGALGTNPSAAAATWWTKAGAPTGPASVFAGFLWDPAYNRTPMSSQCDGKTLIAAVTTDHPQRPVITRLSGRDGTLDANWGTAGKSTITFDAGTAEIGGVAILGRPDGRLVVVGQTNTLDGAWVHQLLP